MTMRRLQHFESVEDELIAEIQALSGERMNSGQPRRVYLERLHTLQRRRIFPFMKLPAELRNLIYPDLLKHNRREGAVAYPAILRTCKKVYKEASSVLNADSLLELNVEFTDHHPSGRLDYHTRGKFASISLATPSEVSGFTHNFRHVQHIALALGPLCSWYRSETTWETAGDLSRFFGRAIGSCKELKSLEVSFAEEWKKELKDGYGLYMAGVFGKLKRLEERGECAVTVKGVREKIVGVVMDTQKRMEAVA